MTSTNTRKGRSSSSFRDTEQSPLVSPDQSPNSLAGDRLGQKTGVRYTALVDGKAGAYGVVFPDLPGCHAMGKSFETALANAGDSMRNWIEVTEEDGREIPAPRPLEKLRRDPEVVAALAEGAMLASIPLIRETGRPVKANLSLDSGVLAAIDAAAKRHKLTRSGMVELMARTTLPRLP
jgi:predicted RNase H-like HicB family nuclease